MCVRTYYAAVPAEFGGKQWHPMETRYNLPRYFRQERQAGERLCQQDRTTQPEEHLSVPRLEYVGKDSADKREEERQSPKPWLRDRLGRHHRKQQEHHQERNCIAKVAAAADPKIK